MRVYVARSNGLVIGGCPNNAQELFVRTEHGHKSSATTTKRVKRVYVLLELWRAPAPSTISAANHGKIGSSVQYRRLHRYP